MNAAPQPKFEYPRDPGRRCDLVMKGGITSGVVYPLAICRLAERFRLTRIGGTSAGAIAAAGAAAAEYGRFHHHAEAEHFAALESLPAWLGENPGGGAELTDESNLFALFQPAPATRGLFALLVAGISHPGPTVAFEIVLSAVANWRRWAILGALPGLAVFGLVFLTLADRGGVLATIALLAGLLAAVALTMIGAIGAAAAIIYRRAPAALQGNHFGICNGMRAADASDGTPEALTEWFHGFLQRAAGEPGGVLTFGRLWYGPEARPDAEGPHDVDLAMITTCLTLGRPFRLPFMPADGFFFDPEELGRLFPADVVAHMRAAGEAARQELGAAAEGGAPSAAERARHEEAEAAGGLGLLPMPKPYDLPIVFAARLSLSFPFLLSTIPLYRAPAEPGGDFVRCHFSDGGICSNFPIHFFDSPLPRWPTFGINLAGRVPAGAPAADEVWMPLTNEGRSIAVPRPVDGMGRFVASIRGAAQNWHDNAYVEMPGYRDRIVHILFREGEGGLNLNMPPTLIGALSMRGERAGSRLVARFAGVAAADEPETELNWNNHRHIRQRLAWAAFEQFLVQLAVGHTGDAAIVGEPRTFLPHAPMEGELSYDELLGRTRDPRGYADFDAGQREIVRRLVEQALPVVQEWTRRRGRDQPPRVTPAMDVDGPEPPMDIRIAPPL